MSNKIRETFEKGGGVFRLLPTWVPRGFNKPGRRLRLHPDDYFALGIERGAIKERWMASVQRAGNGPLTADDEGMSYVSASNDPKDKFLLKDAVEELGAELVGQELMDQFGGWPMYSKFYDYEAPLFHHVHLQEKDAKLMGQNGKPEAYYFPPQYNNYPGKFPHTYFGFDPDVTKEEVKERLAKFKEGDTRITELSRAYRIQLGTGWYTPPGVIHAPGSYLTYEPQWNADANSVYENVVDGECYPYTMLVEAMPEEKWNDLDAVIDLLDWEKNVDPNYRKHYFRPPVEFRKGEGYVEKYITYGTGYIAAKELSIEPGATVTIQDDFAYGIIITQGHGQFGAYACAEAGMLRYGGLSEDEFFISAPAAKKGIVIRNDSNCEPLVMLKHFPANAEEPKVEGIRD